MVQIVLGPPGTGKTTTLVGMVESELARGVPPDRIGYVSFTRRAAREATTRACEKFGLTQEDFPHFSTLHALCYRQLGMRRGEVLEGKRLQDFAEYAGIEITGRWSDDGTLWGYTPGDRMMFVENLARVRGVPLRDAYDQDDDNISWHALEQVQRALVAFKAAHGLRDFTDMLTEFARSGIRLHLRTLLVDEAQDLSQLQWRVVYKLAEGCETFAVAGDDDQAIYRWAGADVDHLIDLRGDARVLGQSYRVPPAVQAVANRIIRRVRHRREKMWAPRVGEEGVVDRMRDIGDVDCVQGEQTLVLARNSYILREQVEPEMRRRGIIYMIGDKSSVRPEMLALIHDWEALRKGGRLTLARVRDIYERMSVGVGVRRGFKTLPNVQDDELAGMAELRGRYGLLTDKPWYEAMDRLALRDVEYIRSALRRGDSVTKPRVVLSTIHGAKGGEADHVVLMREMAWRTYKEWKENPEDEARVWYVGVTRARRRLTLVSSSTAQEFR